MGVLLLQELPGSHGMDSLTYTFDDLSGLVFELANWISTVIQKENSRSSYCPQYSRF